MPLQKKSPIPQVVIEAFDEDEAIDEPPAESDYRDGQFRRKTDGLVYAMCIRDKDLRGKTRYLRNSARTWCGTEVEFKDQFEKA